MTPIRISLLAATCAGLLSAPAAAQLVAFDFTPERRCTGLFFWDDGAHPGSVVIHYGAPEWKPDYAQLVERERAESLRLGKDHWTTLENSLPLRFGEATLPVGYWYLALHKDAGGHFRLAVFDAARLREQRIPASDTGDAEPEHRIPLAMDELDELVPTLRIAVDSADDAPRSCRLAIRWGRYALSAPFTAVMDGPPSRQQQFRDALAEMLELLDEGRHLELIRGYANPELVARMDDATLKSMVAEFSAGDKPQRLADALRLVVELSPDVAGDQTEVQVRNEDLPGKSITFRYGERGWYLVDQ